MIFNKRYTGGWNLKAVICAWVVMAFGPMAFAEGKKEILDKYTVVIVSTKDQSAQKALFYAPEKHEGASVPLLVMLHTWSCDYKQGVPYVGLARERGWAMVAPNFRGPNTNPDACASELAVQDILDAVQFAKDKTAIDDSRIYLVGASGGGHMALVMAACVPQLWAAVSAWVPITDLAAWHAQNMAKDGHYARMLDAICGGPPGPETEKDYMSRSSLPILANAAGLPVDINAGIHDGHTGSVPISQSLNAFNVLAKANGMPEQMLTDKEIAFMTAKEAVPSSLADEHESDPERSLAVLFRRTAGPVRVTIFEGGHTAEPAAALNWLSRQTKGKTADMSVPDSTHLKQGAGQAEEVAR